MNRISKLYGTVFIVISFATNCHLDRKLEKSDEGTVQVRCDINEYRIDNLCEDEKVYLDWAASLKKYPKLSDLNKDVLHKLTQETLDVDKTSALFYHRAINDPRNKKFLDYLDKKEKQLQKKLPDFSSKKVLLAMVPGMFYKDNPEVGADGKILRDIALELGLMEELVPVEQTGTLEENSQIICDYVKNKTDVNGIIFASVSKGSSDLKIAFKKCGHEKYFKKVRGWYNIGGINKGSHLIEEIDGNWNYRWETKFYFWWRNYNYKGFLDLKAYPGGPLDFDLNLSKDILQINIIAVPQFRQVTKRAYPFYEYLIRFGPNDGMTLLADSYIEEAITYPSWRNDHYFQWPMVHQRMQAFLVYIMENQFP
ncbi:MAG: hypothetical protein JJT78_03415 [Leptospira sp.]|nr:hypothetical protein [Leptospira sp.]